MSKVALVTGGSRGIGFGIAEKLAAEKWDLVINGVREEAAVAEPLAKLRSMGVRVGYARGDVGSREGREAILKTTRGLAVGWRQETRGKSSDPLASSPTPLASINLLVNNAGVAPKVRADLLETSED